jgi:nucleoredoxin
MSPFARSLSCLALLLAASFVGPSRAQTPTPAATGPTGLAAKFDYHLVKLDHGQLKPLATASLNNIKFFAFYYSASWCPPCRAFTPKLVDFYNSFKPQHPDFEVIFVCHDNNANDMLDYMMSDSMPWTAARFEDIDGSNANQYCGSGIPDLVLVNADGKVLSDSFHGSYYAGPDKVLEDIKRMVH